MNLIKSLLLILLFSSCNSDSSTYTSPHDNGQTYEENKMSLGEKEKRNPLQFLESNGTYRQNLVGKWVVEGKIRNKATTAAFKDVTVQINFYSKTNTLLGSEKKTIYEYVNPGRSSSFKFKLSGYRNTSKIGWEIVDAKSAN